MRIHTFALESHVIDDVDTHGLNWFYVSLAKSFRAWERGTM